MSNTKIVCNNALRYPIALICFPQWNPISTNEKSIILMFWFGAILSLHVLSVLIRDKSYASAFIICNIITINWVCFQRVKFRNRCCYCSFFRQLLFFPTNYPSICFFERIFSQLRLFVSDLPNSVIIVEFAEINISLKSSESNSN